VAKSQRECRGDVTRRKFLERLGIATAVGGGIPGSLALPSLSWADEGDAGPVDCGPPPLAKPQHQTGGESFPPLPLPATPLRRSEKKRPPSPPALIGKAALGSTRWTTKDGRRVQYRDWMTDPADVMTLLSWTAGKLGISYRAIEVDFAHFSFDPRELPVLLFAGHNKFALTDELRPKLARFVMDGGTILGDACCGWKDFADSFRREMELIFPNRPLHKMLPDEPAYSSYYKLGNLTYKKGDGSTFSEPPCLEGIDFGCRAGVIFSPRDLTCGWDGHEHPRGTRVVIDEARQVGANLITYILGTFQLGRFLSTTKVYQDTAASSRDDFVFAQLMHQGDWDPDPSAVHNLLKFARDNSTLEVKFKRENVRLKDPKAATYPLLYMTGHRDFLWTAEEAAALGRYLKAGGLLLADACCGRLAFDASFRREIAKALPGQKLARLPADHPLYHAHYDIKQVEYTPRVREDFGAINTPELEGITLDGRLAVIYSRFDLGNGWEQFPHAYSYGLKDDSALRIGTNVLVFAVTH
jgi:hypothetical protein